MSSDMELDETLSVECCKANEKLPVNLSLVLPTSTNVTFNSEEHWITAQERLRSNIHLLNSSTCQNDERNQILTFVEELIGKINDSLKQLSHVATPSFAETIQFLIVLINYKNVDQKIRLDAVKAVITLHKQGIYHLTPKNYVMVVCFLLENCCLNQVDKSVTPFLKDLRKFLMNSKNEPFKSAMLEEKKKIINIINIILGRIQFCCTDLGLDIVAYTVSLATDFFKVFQENVKRILLSCKRSEALRFGTLYYRIWDLLEDNQQKVFEESYIQWLMERAFTLDRRKPPVRNLSLNLQSLLTGLHNSRKKAKFSKVLTDLYSPILWKYLNSNNNIHRSNAAEIFMNVYPLEETGKSMKKYSMFLRKQHDELLTLLDDPCPTVRVIAIKGACSNLRYFWVTFQNGTAEKIIEKFVTDLVTDGSSCDVRKAVYQGLTQLLFCKESHTLLKGVLPSLGGFIHDENQSVRQAFISMLRTIKSHGREIKYWNIVDLHNFAARLVDDTAKNRDAIVDLIFSSFFNEKLSLEESLHRFCKFISVNPSAIRYIAIYSTSNLKFVDAINTMCFILRKMAESVNKRMQTFSEDNQEVEEAEHASTSKADKVLVDSENIESEDKENVNTANKSVTSIISNATDSNRSTNFLDPRITHGLLDFVAILWTVHGKKLLEEENEELLEKLYNVAVKCIPVVLRLFKGTHAYYGALYLACFIPLSRIGHAATVIGSSVSILRQMSPDTPDNEIRCVVYVLCVWKRGDEVIGLAKEWLDEAFRLEALNESYAPEKNKRQKRVRFPRSEPKPEFALRILNELFSSPRNQTFIFSYHISELKNLLSFLSKIKIVIDRRIDKECEINSVLSDKVLIDTLTLYGNIIILFNENKVQNFNFWRKFTKYLEWCSGIVVRCSPIELEDGEVIKIENTFVSQILHVPLMQCLNLIAIGKCSDEQLIILLKFCKSCLDSESGLQFVELSVQLLKQLILFSRVHHAKERQTEIMTFWFPSIVDKLLTLLTDRIYSKDVLSSCIKNVVNLKKDIMYIFILTGKLYPEMTHSSPSLRIMNSFCQALINILLFPITECETLNVDENLKNLPYIGSFLASIFMSQLDLGSALLYALKILIDRFTEKDGLLLLATSSLLYTFAFCDCKIPKSDVLQIVKLTYKKLDSLPAEEGQVALVMNREQTIADRTIIDIEEATESAVKEVGQHILKKIAEHVGGSLS